MLLYFITNGLPFWLRSYFDKQIPISAGNYYHLRSVFISLLVLQVLLVLTFPLFTGDHSGVSSFNKFIHDLPVDSDSSSVDYSSAEEDCDGVCPPSPSSQGSHIFRASNVSRNDWHATTGWTIFLISWILFPSKILLGIPVRLCRFFYTEGSTAPSPRVSHQNLRRLHTIRKMHTLRDHGVHHTTDRRRGVIEVSA